MLSPQDNENDKAEKGDNGIKRLIEERWSIAKGAKKQLKEVSKKIAKCIRDKNKIKKTRRFSGFWKNSEVSTGHIETSNLENRTAHSKGEN